MISTVCKIQRPFLGRMTITIFFLLCIVFKLSAQQVVINEVLAGPPPNPNDFSTQNTANANSLYSLDPSMLPSFNREYIELYNTSPCDTIDIGCYTIGSNANSPVTGPNWGAFTFPAGTKIPPLGFIIIGGNDAQVPYNDFNITWYRQNHFNTQYLCGDATRWFLRDAWGWVALYDDLGNPVDAVYWNDWSGSAMSLNTQDEYQNPIVNTMACGGTKILPAASAINGIQYVGHIISGTFLSFQREQDGSPNWHSSPVYPTPRAPNGTPIQPPYVSHTVIPEYCGHQDGEIILQITPGGTGPYTVYWNGSAVPGGLTLSNLSAGTYTLIVRDAFDCLNVFDTITVTDNAGPQILILSVDDEKCSAADGSVTTQIQGGLQPYSITWNTTPASTMASISGLQEGSYIITVIDASGCEASDSVSIQNHKEPLLDLLLLSADSCGYNNGMALARVTGDYHPYSYSWSSIPQQQDSIASNLPAGNYSVTITDGVCTASAQILVPLIPGPNADFMANPEILYLQDGTVEFTDLSQGMIKEWLWDFNDGSFSFLQHPAHTFTSLGSFNITLTVTDDIGCKADITKPLIVKDITSAFFPNAFTPDGDGLNDYFMPKGIYITNYRLLIYDRAGRTVFGSVDPNEGWDGSVDGRPAQEGVYVWTASFSHDYGENRIRDLNLYGTVTLIR